MIEPSPIHFKQLNPGDPNYLLCYYLEHDYLISTHDSFINASLLTGWDIPTLTSHLEGDTTFPNFKGLTDHLGHSPIKYVTQPEEVKGVYVHWLLLTHLLIKLNDNLTIPSFEVFKAYLKLEPVEPFEGEGVYLKESIDYLIRKGARSKQAITHFGILNKKLATALKSNKAIAKSLLENKKAINSLTTTRDTSTLIITKQLKRQQTRLSLLTGLTAFCLILNLIVLIIFALGN